MLSFDKAQFLLSNISMKTKWIATLYSNIACAYLKLENVLDLKPLSSPTAWCWNSCHCQVFFSIVSILTPNCFARYDITLDIVFSEKIVSYTLRSLIYNYQEWLHVSQYQFFSLSCSSPSIHPSWIYPLHVATRKKDYWF